MAVDAVTPIALLTSVVTTGATPVQVAPGGENGGFITNPADPTDQGLGTAEDLYVTCVGSAPGSAPGDGNGTTFVLFPGQTWEFIPGQTTATWVNAASNGHKFSGIRY